MSSRDNTKEEPMRASIINHKSSNSSINNRPPTANTGALPSEQQPPAETTVSPAPASPGDDNDDDAKPPFEPLFTLLTNVTRNSTVHPRVRYVFSDDDAASVLAAEEGSKARGVIIDLAAAPPAEEDEGGGGGGGARWRIAGASSLSGDFAVTDASLAAQQDGALMLRVDGVEREKLPEEEEGSGGTEDVEGLMEEFRRRLGVLRMVVKEGERSDEEEDKVE